MLFKLQVFYLKAMTALQTVVQDVFVANPLPFFNRPLKRERGETISPVTLNWMEGVREINE